MGANAATRVCKTPLGAARLAGLIEQAGGITAVAHHARVREATIYLWLKKGNLGGVRFETVCRLAELFGVKPEELR